MDRPIYFFVDGFLYSVNIRLMQQVPSPSEQSKPVLLLQQAIEQAVGSAANWSTTHLPLIFEVIGGDLLRVCRANGLTAKALHNMLTKAGLKTGLRSVQRHLPNVARRRSRPLRKGSLDSFPLAEQMAVGAEKGGGSPEGDPFTPVSLSTLAASFDNSLEEIDSKARAENLPALGKSGKQQARKHYETTR
jgi:hypothetical protein